MLKESRLKAQKHVTLLTHTEAESFQNMCVLNNMHGNMKTGENRMGVYKKILSYVTWSQQQAKILIIKMLEKVYFLAVVKKKKVFNQHVIATWEKLFGYYY